MSEEPIYVSGLGLVEMYVLIMAMAKLLVIGLYHGG